MKLLQKTGQYYLLFSLIIFSLGGLIMFLVLRKVLDYETDEGLQHTRQVLKPYLEQQDALPPRLHVMDEVVELRRVNALSDLSSFADTVFYDTIDQELEPYRTYHYSEKINGEFYEVALHHSRVENEDLITTILLVNLGVLGLLLLALNQISRSISQKLWQPFYETISQIQAFSMQEERPLQLPATSTEEFDQLNRSFKRMAEKLQRDFRNLRRFTENASHEMQTPLAIMRNQVDLLLQSNDRSEADYEKIRYLSEAISRLGKLNKALLLLTRIENEQFQSSEPLDLLPLLNQKLDALQPLLIERGITFQSILADCTLPVHPILADVLLNNLLDNAIKHNVPDGKIDLVLDQQHFCISNTGYPVDISPDDLMERFAKGRSDSQSLGLGLAIVHEICKLYGWELEYVIEEDQHRITISF
ncbi:MAG: ATP-binding protein [Saprospiraceae bacterium]|nr:hypothetical protein [Lewinella sp.]